MGRSSIFDDEHMRIRLMLALMTLAFLGLAAALWRIQVEHGKQYQSDLMRQSVRRVRIPGIRGRIVDRHGAYLADNRPSYCIAIYLEELRRPGRWPRTIDAVEELLSELALELGIPCALTRDDIWTHIRKRLPLPLLAWKDIDEAALARFYERVGVRPGVDVFVESVRIYPEGGSACHTLGYVGRADPPTDESEPFHYYLPEMEGKSGVERRYDDVLRGQAGGVLVRVDVSGFKHDEFAQRPSRNGRDLMLTLDTRVQKLAEQSIAGANGAVVVLDPNNGDVLALASSPGFDPNDFIPAISREQWNRLLQDERTPLFNRAAAGAFPPGSIFKPLVALAALENGKATAATAFDCPGYFELGRSRMRCWLRSGHGVLNMRQSLEHSCNVYYFRLGLLCGIDPIHHMAAALGFGRKTGIGLDYEVAGILPSDGWKRRVQGDGWRDGDTCNLSIGQGFLTTTPLQMALFCATLANGGRLFQPRLVLGIRERSAESFAAIPPSIANELNWNPEHIRLIRLGMRDVVNSPTGTGKYAKHPRIVVAGKTGTAEIGPKAEGRKLGWMIAFAPFDKPRYAVAMVVEDAVSGGVTAAPRMSRLLNGLFGDLDPRRGRG